MRVPRVRLTVRTLMVLVLVLGGVLGWVVHRARVQREAVAAIKRAGGNPFMDYSVPEAVIKLKQGFGRLIRSKTDKGIVVILDSRVTGKRYGKLFLDALPGCKVVKC